MAWGCVARRLAELQAPSLLLTCLEDVVAWVCTAHAAQPITHRRDAAQDALHQLHCEQRGAEQRQIDAEDDQKHAKAERQARMLQGFGRPQHTRRTPTPPQHHRAHTQKDQTASGQDTQELIRPAEELPLVGRDANADEAQDARTPVSRLRRA